MLVIIGLGNPGEKYKRTRHNAGFLLIDELQKKWDLPDFSFDKKFGAEISEGKFQNNKVLLAKPQLFMNRSGETVQQIIHFYKLSATDIIIAHDDLDIEIGNWKFSEDLSSAGHNGVENIIEKIGTQNFKRVRIGVEAEGGREMRGPISGEKFVLQNFSDDELEKIKDLNKIILKKLPV